MSIFSKLFSSSRDTKSPKEYDSFTNIENLLKDEAEFYTNTTLFHLSKERTIKYMMLHPQLGIVLFNYFNYSANELKGATVCEKDEHNSSAEIQTQDDKSFIEHRFDEIFHTQIAPITSVLICPQLSEADFDNLDESFHKLIPKHLALFNDQNHATALKALINEDKSYELSKMKQALFSELIIAHANTLMSKVQQDVVHLDLQKRQCVHGLPGSGKSSVLIAKALYEKKKNPNLKLIIFAKRACNVHFLQSLIFEFIEHTNWTMNPADIMVSSFDSLQRRAREKQKYELIVCDNFNQYDLEILNALLSSNGKLLLSSLRPIAELSNYALGESYRISAKVSAACEGLKVDDLRENLSFVHGNAFMNTILTLANLLKEVPANEISIVHSSKEESLGLQNEINEYFEPIAYLFDDPDRNDEILIYPLTHLACVINTYVIVIIDEESIYDKIELISRAKQKSFILSQNVNVYDIIKQIKEDQII